MRARFCALMLLLVAAPLVACQKEGPPPTTSSGGGGGVVTTPAADAAATPAAVDQALACQNDADCEVSCARVHDCCNQLCPPCTQVFNHAALAAIMQWRKDSCPAAQCPMAKCMAPREDTVAHCTSGQCTVERVPAQHE